MSRFSFGAFSNEGIKPGHIHVGSLDLIFRVLWLMATLINGWDNAWISIRFHWKAQYINWHWNKVLNLLTYRCTTQVIYVIYRTMTIQWKVLVEIPVSIRCSDKLKRWSPERHSTHAWFKFFHFVQFFVFVFFFVLNFLSLLRGGDGLQVSTKMTQHSRGPCNFISADLLSVPVNILQHFGNVSAHSMNIIRNY